MIYPLDKVIHSSYNQALITKPASDIIVSLCFP